MRGRALARPDSASGPGFSCGKHQGEARARLRGLDIDATAVLLHDLLHDREAEAGASLLSRRHEGLKQAALDLLRDAGTRVRHGDREVSSAQLARDRERPALFAHRLDRVAREIVKRSSDARLVEARRELGVDLRLELDRASAGVRHLDAELPFELAEELPEEHAPHEDGAIPARELEHLALHGGEHVELLQNELAVFLPLRSLLRVGHQLHVAADHGHRRLEVVNHLRQAGARSR